jgi:hypothetical protein
LEENFQNRIYGSRYFADLRDIVGEEFLLEEVVVAPKCSAKLYLFPRERGNEEDY